MTQCYIEHMHANGPVHTWPWKPLRRMARPRAARRESPIELFAYHSVYRNRQDEIV
jgi:hypothetical protein